jgi:MutS domain V
MSGNVGHARAIPTAEAARPATDPKGEYLGRRSAHCALAEHFARREAIVGWIRSRLLIPFATLVVFFVAKERYSTQISAIALVSAVFAGLLSWHGRVGRSLRRALRAGAYYERGIDRLEGRWPGRGLTGARFLQADHLYAFDLDVFGEGSLFERLAIVRTGSGESVLASWLLAPAAPAEIRARQEAVAELRDRVDFREQVALLGATDGERGDPEPLHHWAAGPPVLTPSFLLLAVGSVSLLVLLSVAGWLLQFVGYETVIAAFAVQAGCALWLRRRVRSVLTPVQGQARHLALWAEILDLFEREAITSSWFVERRSNAETAYRSAAKSLRQLVRLLNGLELKWHVYLMPLPSLFLWTTGFAMAVDRWRRTNGPRLASWIRLAGEQESILALGTYAYENPADPFPTMVSEGASLEAEALGHPLLPPEACVPNDVCLGRGVQLLVVSGSNMSGKSTFLRSAGLNVVLAQAGAPVRAARMSVSPLVVGATLRVLDSVQLGRSRFYAEIMRIRRIVEIADGRTPVLFLLDEILHGTNSLDRRVGAEAIVRSLVDAGAVGLITTHDLSLTEIADALGSKAMNVHFEDRLDDGKIVFDYQLRPGVVQKSNALALMRSIGLKV